MELPATVQETCSMPGTQGQGERDEAECRERAYDAARGSVLEGMLGEQAVPGGVERE